LTKAIFEEGWYPIPKTGDTMRKQGYPIELSEIERVELEDIIRKDEHKARVIRRAQALLWSSGGKSDLEIAELHRITPLTVANTRKRWVKKRSLEDRCCIRKRRITPDTSEEPPLRALNHWVGDYFVLSPDCFL
jgi:hypothetical protein